MAPRPESYDQYYRPSLFADDERSLARGIAESPASVYAPAEKAAAERYLAQLELEKAPLVFGENQATATTAAPIAAPMTTTQQPSAPSMVQKIKDPSKLEGFVGQLQGLGSELASGRKDLAAKLDPIQKKEMRAQEEFAALQEQMAAERAQTMGRHQKDLEKIDADMTRADQMRRTAESNALRYVQQVQAEARDLNIDPNRFWSKPNGDEDFGKRVVAALAIFGAGVGSAMTGRGTEGAEQAISIINGFIDRDIDAQKANAQLKRGAAGDVVNQYQLLLSQHQNDRVAESQLRIQMLERAKAKFEQLAAEYEVPVMQQQALAASAAAERQQAVEFEKINREAIADEVQTRGAAAGIEAQVQQQQAVRGADLMKVAPATAAEAEAFAAKRMRRFAPPISDKVNEKAMSDHGELEDVSMAARSLYTFLFGGVNPQTGEHMDGVGAELARSENAIVADSLRGALMIKIKGPAWAQLGQIAGADSGLIEKILPEDSTGWRQDSIKMVLKNLIAGIDSKDRINLDSAGVERLDDWGVPQNAKQVSQGAKEDVNFAP